MLEGTMQDLVDRLEVATSEQDVLYVLVVLHQMKESGSLKQAINSPHSWKRQTALESIDSLPSQLSTLHRLIAQLLLLRGARYDVGKGQNEELKDLVSRWEQGGSEKEHLLTLDLEDAANWIDMNLPVPPNPELLTGAGPLPALPFDNLDSSVPNHMSQGDTLASVSPTRVDFVAPLDLCFAEEASSSSSSMQHSLSPESTSTCTSFVTPSSFRLDTEEAGGGVTVSQEELVDLHVCGFPKDFTLKQLNELFTDIGIRVYHSRIPWDGYKRTFAFVGVKRSVGERSIDSLHQKVVQGCKVSCAPAKSRPIPPTPCPALPDSAPPHPVPSRPKFQPSRPRRDLPSKAPWGLVRQGHFKAT
ncbi:uncharacterized protein JCM6883_005852 [Sporobolomyces salmoneus]|uniref:uncharacterized protein n=1 Tax=Sporobolomyces salmoneus TaxID=183962 RepID=UPI003175146A